jgi:prefoldin subunit 5
MAPMEAQVREHQVQLKRRLESIKRIHQATDTLEQRIEELSHAAQAIGSQIASLDLIGRSMQQQLTAGGFASLRQAA